MSATPSGLARPTAVITAGNVASRVTGFVRVLAIGGALGTTFVGNTYQTSNLVSNIAFELLAAGMLSSVLVPAFVALGDEGRDDDAERAAGAILGLALVALGVVVAVGLLCRPLIMRVLTVAVEDAEVRDDEVRLGSTFLVFFLPQVLLYAVGAVATAVLHSRRRFAAAAFAPVANNVVVTLTMVVFAWQRHATDARGAPGLDLPTSQQLVLAIGTTAGVIALSAVPLAAAWRGGIRLRPRWEPGNPHLRSLLRPGAWAAGFLALNQVLIAVTLVLANRVAGGVVAYQIAYTFFLLPFAVLANPVFTALYPRMSSEAHGGRWRDFARSTGAGTRVIAFLVLPASALLVALSLPLLRVVRVGALDPAGASLVARVVGAYALGLVGYSLFQHLTRASYATRDTRSPTLVALCVTVAGVALMIGLSAAVGDGGGDGNEADRVVVLGLAHSAAMLAGAVWMLAVVRRRVGERLGVAVSLVRSLAGAAAAGLAARLLADALSLSGRGGAAATLVVAGAAGVSVYAAGAWVTRAPELEGLGLASSTPDEVRP